MEGALSERLKHEFHLRTEGPADMAGLVREEKGRAALGFLWRQYLAIAEKYGLPFPLLSDEGLEAIRAYDVWQEKNMYGKKVMGVVRTTYLIDENGVIVRAFSKVKAEENPQQMLDTL